jgi:hypothetical protein
MTFKRKCCECGSTNLAPDLTCKACGVRPRATVGTVSSGAGGRGTHSVDPQLQARSERYFEQQGLKRRADESAPEWRARVNAWSRERLRNARMNRLAGGGIYTGWADQVIARIEKGEPVSSTAELMAREVIRNRDGGDDAWSSKDLRGWAGDGGVVAAGGVDAESDRSDVAPAPVRPHPAGFLGSGDGADRVAEPAFDETDAFAGDQLEEPAGSEREGGGGDEEDGDDSFAGRWPSIEVYADDEGVF